MSEEEENPLTASRIVAETSGVAGRVRRARARVAEEKATPEGKFIANIMVALAALEAGLMAEADSQPPVGAILGNGYIAIYGDRIDGAISIVVSHPDFTNPGLSHPYSRQEVAKYAYNRCRFTKHSVHSELGKTEIAQFAETGILEGDDWWMRIVLVSLVVREEEK